MRRSLRRIANREVDAYSEGEQLFTTLSLEEAKERLTGDGRELSAYCFHSWVREGVRYFRVWEDKRLKESVAEEVPFGEVVCTLKRAEAEKLYIKAKRYKGEQVGFTTENGVLRVLDAATNIVKAVICVPATGGELVLEPADWSERQAAHFINVLLVRDHGVDAAFTEANSLR